MKNCFAKFLVLFFASFPSNAPTAMEDYKCTIERYSSIDGNTSDSESMYVKLYIGKEFTVERKTGLMAGALKNSYVNKPLVVDFGSSDNSYKVVNYMKLEQGVGYGTNIYALTIEEFAETKNKPFLFLQNSKVFFGKCVHF